jgi:hypothetical protein
MERYTEMLVTLVTLVTIGGAGAITSSPPPGQWQAEMDMQGAIRPGRMHSSVAITAYAHFDNLAAVICGRQT